MFFFNSTESLQKNEIQNWHFVLHVLYLKETWLLLFRCANVIVTFWNLLWIIFQFVFGWKYISAWLKLRSSFIIRPDFKMVSFYFIFGGGCFPWNCMSHFQDVSTQQFYIKTCFMWFLDFKMVTFRKVLFSRKLLEPFSRCLIVSKKKNMLHYNHAAVLYHDLCHLVSTRKY